MPNVAERRLTWSVAALAGAIALVAGAVAALGTYWVVRDGDAPPPGADCGDGAAGALDVSEIIERVSPSVVAVRVSTAGSESGPAVGGVASGFVVDTRGHIVTNEHVIAGATTIDVTFADGRSVSADVVGFDYDTDIAVLAVTGSTAPPLEFGNSSELRLGEPVVVVSDWRAPEGGPSASLGIVSAVDRDVLTSSNRGYTDLIQTDAAMGSGDSGGPMVDASGLVVGVVVAGSISGQCIGFAIPIDLAAPAIEAIIAAGR